MATLTLIGQALFITSLITLAGLWLDAKVLHPTKAKTTKRRPAKRRTTSRRPAAKATRRARAGARAVRG